MAQNGKRLDIKRSPLWKTFEENSDEALAQIRSFCTNPVGWLVMIASGFALIGLFFLISFLLAVRAPELIPTPNANVEAPIQTAEELPEEIDDSNAVQPLLSGERKEGVYTFLLFGTDKEGTNTDTIMAVSYDVPNQKLNLMSIPRDTMVNVGWDIKKINSVYGIRGLSGFRKQIAKLLGFSPDYYVKIDLQAFVDVVDLIGGVEYDVPFPMHYHDPYQDLSIDLEPGLQLLNGEQAMGLVRFRKSDRSGTGRITGYDDTGRVQTQQEFLKAMFRKCIKLTNWTKISSYVEIFQRNVESELTLGNMLWFARQAMELGEGDFFTVTAPGNYYASAYSRSTNTMQSYVTLYGKEMVKLVNERFNPYLTQVSMANLDIMGVNSVGSVYSSTGHVADSAAALPVARDKDEETSKDETEEPETDAVMPEDEEPPFDPAAEEEGSGASEEPSMSDGAGIPKEETVPEPGEPEDIPPEPEEPAETAEQPITEEMPTGVGVE